MHGKVGVTPSPGHKSVLAAAFLKGMSPAHTDRVKEDTGDPPQTQQTKLIKEKEEQVLQAVSKKRTITEKTNAPPARRRK